MIGSLLSNACWVMSVEPRSAIRNRIVTNKIAPLRAKIKSNRKRRCSALTRRRLGAEKNARNFKDTATKNACDVAERGGKLPQVAPPIAVTRFHRRILDQKFLSFRCTRQIDSSIA